MTKCTKRRFLLVIFCFLIDCVSSGFCNQNDPADALNQGRKWNITVCAMLRNVFAYTLEWIEFHRIQGVDHFVLYDDASEDDIHLLPLLYASIGHPDLVEILPANALRESRLSNHTWKEHDHNQRQILQHCFARYRNHSEWFLIIDADEFMYSPHYGTIQNFLNVYDNYTADDVNEAHLVSEFMAQPVRFGTAGLIDDFRVRLHAEPAVGLRVLYEPRDVSSGLYPVILEANPRRAPHPQLDQNYQEMFHQICDGTAHPELCQHNIGKSLFKANRCRSVYIHWCQDLIGHTTEPPLSELRLDHFPWKSKENVLTKLTSDWHRKKIEAYRQLDTIWFSLIADGKNKRYIDSIRQRIAAFNSSVLGKRRHFDERPHKTLAKLTANRPLHARPGYADKVDKPKLDKLFDLLKMTLKDAR
ncbi:uncharacterized protein LOC129588567 [Paramacrobiotus metropolitanus]|uniref:uncharacterized protein LOC129588567 n=1 Tax=Paramacrobiotus metropolitanus TaxID=2943436 RepID=UPI002445C9CF|nr:uncharacterized protein LOC129588567 [Paramacrobiotus metropolitanus]